MRKILTLFILCVSFLAFGQVNVGSKIRVVGYGKDKIDRDAMSRLMRSKTYFVYGEQDEKNLEDWKKALKKSWKLTPLGFMSLEEFNALDIEGWEGKTFIIKYQDTYVWKERNDRGIDITKSWAYPCLTVLGLNPEGEYSFYCRIDLSPNPKTKGYTRKFHRLSEKEKTKYLYGEAVFFNWHPGLLMAPLAFVSQSLKENEPISIFKNIKPKVELGELKTKTLYVPEYAFLYWWGSNPDRPYVDIEKVKSKYDYEIKIVSAERLSELIMNKDKDFHLMFYSRVIHDKFISIWDTKNCELLYKEYKANSHNIKGSDFKKLSKAIRKAASKAEKESSKE